MDAHGGLLTTQATINEVLGVLARPRIALKIATDFVANLRRIFTKSESVTIVQTVVGCRDPDDDMFLEPAVNGRADLLISGDADLLALDPFRGISIITPASFGLLRAVEASRE